MDVERLLSDYNYYRSHTAHLNKLRAQGAYVRDLKTTRSRLQALGDMARWCSEHQLDPRLWLYSLFSGRRWLFAPRFDQFVPRTPKTEKKALARYHALQDVPTYHERAHQEIHQRRVNDGREVDVNRDLTNAAEALKRRYLAEGNPGRCLDEMEGRTYGYHPRSVVCLCCPRQRECADKLCALVGYDVIALRRGEITVGQARAQAWGGEHGRA